MWWGWGWVVVKHSRAEFTRKRGRARTAGTQQLDRQWHHVKKSVPKQWTTTSKGKIRERALWKYLWRGQWRRLNEGHVFTSLGKLCKHTEMKGSKKKIANEDSLEHKCKYIAKNNELEQNHPFGARSSTFLLICISTINMIHVTKTLRFLKQTLTIANSTGLLRAL